MNVADNYNFDFNCRQWCAYLVRHPFEGFEDLRWKKAYSMRAVFVTVALFFLADVFRSVFTGYIFGGGVTGAWNIIPHISLTAGMFFAWTVSSRAVGTLLDGEGSFKAICCTSAYALVPFIVSEFVNVLLSNYLISAESGIMVLVSAIGVCWSFFMIINAVKAVQQYTLPRTLAAILLTAAGMMIMLFLAMVLTGLFQQIFIFIFSIYTELMYRL